MNWRTRMKKQRDLKQKGSQILWQRVKLLIEIEEDSEFHDWCNDQGVDVYEQLDQEVAEINGSYLMLKAVMDAYPEEAAWEKRLDVLIAEVRNRQKKPRKDRESISWKERALAAERECERLRGELERATARIADLERIVDAVAPLRSAS